MQTLVITRDTAFFMALKGKGIINKFLVLIHFLFFELINAVELPGNCCIIYGGIESKGEKYVKYYLIKIFIFLSPTSYPASA